MNIGLSRRPKIAGCLIAFTLLFAQGAFATDCDSGESIILNSQSSVVNFQADYGSGRVCDTITGDLWIGGDDIVDLRPLSGLASINGSLLIQENSLLVNLAGLEGLTSIRGALTIRENPMLEDLDSLSGLTSVGMQCDRSFILCPSIVINRNDALTSVAGLNLLTSTQGDIEISSNPKLVDLDGLSHITEIGGSLEIIDNALLSNIHGLSLLTIVGHNLVQSLAIYGNPRLTDLGGLENLRKVDWLEIDGNESLVNIDGLQSLVDPGRWIYIFSNDSLLNVDGLRSVEYTNDLRLGYNAALSDCQGVVTLIDPIDDHEPGPGPGESGIPDLLVAHLNNNAVGCNSVNEVLGAAPLSQINAGLNDAWFYPETSGQGLFLTVYPEIQQMFLTWFTFDLNRPDDSITAQLGDPGHRWITAQGKFAENQANLDVWMAKGGVFNSPAPEVYLEPDGQITIEFNSCNSGMLRYEFPSVKRQGSVPIERVALGNVPICYVLDKNGTFPADSRTAVSTDFSVK
ncbi:MAG: hypothetical protein OEU52_16985 [Xanthomonadales bacterium]|jgi:hypothetical protein|nr:hypothetical protein [Xanthomonadales bacterium]